MSVTRNRTQSGARRDQALDRSVVGAQAVWFPADAVGPLAAPEVARLNLTLTVGSDADALSMPVSLSRRDRRGHQVRWWGEALDGDLAVELSGAPGGDWSLSLRATDAASTVSRMVRLLDLVDQVHSGAPLRWSVAGSPAVVAGRVTNTRSKVQQGYAAYLHALQELAEHLQEDLTVPALADPDHVRDVVGAAALLRGDTVREQYDQFALHLVSDDLEQLRAVLGAGPVRVVTAQSWQVTGLGRDVELPVTVTYVSTRVLTWPQPSDTERTELVMVPADSPDALLRRGDDTDGRLHVTPLPRLAPRPDADAPPRGRLEADWDTDEGRWAAVHGGHVVVTAATPVELLQELARTGQPYEEIVALKDAPWDHTPAGL